METFMISLKLTVEESNTLISMLMMVEVMTKEMIEDYGDLEGHKNEVLEAKRDLKLIDNIKGQVNAIS